MSETINTTYVPDFVVLLAQIRQLHQDVQSLLTTGVATNQSDGWLRIAYDDLVRRARPIFPAPHMPHLEKAADAPEVYMALGQLVVTLETFIDEAAKASEVPLGFRPRSQETNQPE